MPNVFQRLQHAWSVFRGRDRPDTYMLGEGSSYKPDRLRMRVGNERTIITAIYNRIAVDVASNKIEHVLTDDNGRYKEAVNDSLNECLTIEANVDQTGRAFIQDVVLSMLDEGCVAVVPTNADIDPTTSESYKISALRTAKIVQWYPKFIKVEVYDEETGHKVEKVYPKKIAAIIDNPFYTIMNETNSILQRLIRKLALLDAIDEQTSSGKLDLIIQLPYVTKTPIKQQQAENRRKAIEEQLAGSKYGIAYIDGTEKITQLNRPLENNLLSQVQYLIDTLYSQLGITPEILNGTADEKTMLNYMSRIIEPILSAITDEFKRKFLTKTARSRHHSIWFSRDPFKLVPISNIADIADKFTRNEILTPNELRGIVGFKPVSDPSADELRNRNINQNSQAQPAVDPNFMEDPNMAYQDTEADYASPDPYDIQVPDDSS